MANSTLNKLVVGGLAALAMSCGPSQSEIMRQTYTQDMNNPEYAPVRRNIALQAINEILQKTCEYSGSANEEGFLCSDVIYTTHSGTGFRPGTTEVTTVYTTKSEKVYAGGKWSTVGGIKVSGSTVYINNQKIGAESAKEAEDLKQFIEVYLGRR